jgi:hypothetical protein
VTRLAAAACVTLAALAQLVLAASVGDVRGLPLVPLAVLAAWAVARSPIEAWAGLLPAPLLLGLASDERVGWFVLALAPTPLLAAALRGHHGAPRILAASVAAAAGGAVLYTLLLVGVDGGARGLIDDAAALGRSVVLTCLLAALLAAALLPFRTREHGLFA